MLASMRTIAAEVVETGEKRDQRGRKIVSAAERGRLIAAYAASGLTQKVFCRREGVAYGTFVAWLRRHRESGVALPAAPRSKPARFHELTVAPETMRASTGLEVRLPDGVVIRGPEVDAVVALVRALRG